MEGRSLKGSLAQFSSVQLKLFLPVPFFRFLSFLERKREKERGGGREKNSEGARVYDCPCKVRTMNEGFKVSSLLFCFRIKLLSLLWGGLCGIVEAVKKK